ARFARPVHLHQVDGLDAEAGERGVEVGAQVVRREQAVRVTVLATTGADLGGDHHVALAVAQARDEGRVAVAPAVDWRRVEPGDAEVQCAPYRRDARRVV